MAKIADKYFKTDPWRIIEEGFDKAHSMVAESIFSLGNEYMGARGYFEEGYSGERLQGCYFNGIYEQKKLANTSYKGIVNVTEFMVNAGDFLYCPIRADEELLDLNVSDFSDFSRTLDLKTGLLCRSFIWHTKAGKQIKVTFHRLLSMCHENLGFQKVTLEAIDCSANIEVTMGTDLSAIHQMHKKCYWRQTDAHHDEMSMYIIGETVSTGQRLFAKSSFCIEGKCKDDVHAGIKQIQENELIAKQFVFHLGAGEDVCITRVMENVVQREGIKQDRDNFEAHKAAQTTKAVCEELLKDNRSWWDEVWMHSDIVIDGDEENQQGIRFCIFQMFQTYHGAGEKNNIGAKGLTGEAYNGNAFWDTEVYCLPFFLFHNKKAARKLLDFRFATLSEAKERALSLDCKGAFYPLATISGRECCDLWQHASLQLQPSTSVAYGIWMYVTLTDDIEFLNHQGITMLVEISKMLASRGDWSADKKKFGFYGVMGPDEFQLMVNHNCYTNYMGKFTLDFTLKTLEGIYKDNKEVYQDVLSRLDLSEEEIRTWREMESHIYLPKEEETGIYEQNEGFFTLPHIDVDAIPITDFPLYHNWSYDRIYRNDMIKQPDVLMFMLMFNSSFTMEELKANYEYYEPRCIHESSLSPSVHSILAAQLGKKEEAYELFRFATRMDLDNYNRNSGEGLHTTSIAAAWMNIVYGFGGMRSDTGDLSFAPILPEGWKGYSFRIIWKDITIEISVNAESVICRNLSGGKVSICIYDTLYELSDKEINVTLKI